MPTPTESITAYIRAKDGNRPHLLDASFTPDARLQMRVRTDAISFPPEVQGRDAMAETLVRRFNQTYENIYTLCIGEEPGEHAEAYACDWLVAMSEKQGGAVRVGCGRYDWSFAPAGHGVSALTITIEAMEVLPAGALAPVMNWVASLPYPWSARRRLAAEAPSLAAVRRVLRFLQREGA